MPQQSLLFLLLFLQKTHFRPEVQNKQSLSSQLLSCGDIESNPGPDHIKTNRETSEWLKHLNSQNLTMRENLEEAIVFFGSFRGDHKAFGPWQNDFIRKQKRMKFEAQQRIRRDVGGSGKQFYTPPSKYSPPVQKFEFVGKDLKCQRCDIDFESEAHVIIHIKSVHWEEVRKMFANDASEHSEADEEYREWLNSVTDIYKDNDNHVIKELEKTNKVLLKRLNDGSKDTYRKVSEKEGIIETERVIYSEDGKTKKSVVKEQFAKVTKRTSIEAENIDPDNQKKKGKDQRHQSEKVQNVLQHFAGDDIGHKANILANIVDNEGSDFAASVFSKSKELKQTNKLTPKETAAMIAGANLPDRAVVQMRTACNKKLGTSPFASRHKVEEARERELVIKQEDWESSYEDLYKNKQGKEVHVKKSTCIFTVKNLHQYIEKLAVEDAENLVHSEELLVCLGGDGGGGRFVAEFAFLSTLDKSVTLHPVIIYEGTDCRENLTCTLGKLTPQIRKLEGAVVNVKGKLLKIKVFACFDLCALNSILGKC